MGEPVSPSQTDRLTTRTTAAAVIEAVEADEPMPGLKAYHVPLHKGSWWAYDKQTVDALLLAFAQEIVALQGERDEWKRRAEQHGCDVEKGDPDCG